MVRRAVLRAPAILSCVVIGQVMHITKAKLMCSTTCTVDRSCENSRIRPALTLFDLTPRLTWPASEIRQKSRASWHCHSHATSHVWLWPSVNHGQKSTNPCITRKWGLVVINQEKKPTFRPPVRYLCHYRELYQPNLRQMMPVNSAR